MNSSSLTIRRFAVFAALGLLCPAMTQAAVIRFNKLATVHSSVITLGDIAGVLDVDPKEADRLKAIVIAPAPPVGRTKRLDLSLIQSRLQAHGVSLAQTELTGSSVVTVSQSEKKEMNFGPLSPRARRLAENKRTRAMRTVSKAIESHIGRIAPQLGAVSIEIEIDHADVPTLLKKVVGFEVRGGAPPWNGPQYFDVRFLDRNEQQYQLRIEGRIVQRPSILVARHTIEPGQLIKPEDLVWRQSSASSNAFVRLKDVVNQEARRTIRKNAPILRRDVRKIPLIRSNDIVTVVARAGGVVVRRVLKARGEGALDETVMLQSLDGKKKVLARVTGYHEAEVIGAPGPAGKVYQPKNSQIHFRETGTPPNKIAQTRPAQFQTGFRQPGRRRSAFQRRPLRPQTTYLGRPRFQRLARNRQPQNIARPTVYR